MKDAAYVYALTCPRTGAVRYIGKTIFRLEERLRRHLQEAPKDTPKSQWIQKLKSLGLKPNTLLLETVDKRQALEAEQHWITLFQEEGAALTNFNKIGKRCAG